MLSQWYDPLLIVGLERTLPSRLAVVLNDLGVDIRPTPRHLDETLMRWEDWEVRKALMAVLGERMPLRTFNLRIAILSEQRRKQRKPWGIAASYFADVPAVLLSHYLNPKVLWCQCTPAEAADLLLSTQPPSDRITSGEALSLCTRRHQALSRWLDGYEVLSIDSKAIHDGDGIVVDQIVDFCGLTPTTDHLYRAMVRWPYQGEPNGNDQEDAENAHEAYDDGRGKDVYVVGEG